LVNWLEIPLGQVGLSQWLFSMVV